MVTLNDSLRGFLTANATSHNRDLVERFLDASPLEVQINVRTDIGRPVEDLPGVREHDGFQFSNMRYPKNAKTSPDWTPRIVSYPFDYYAAEIGSTGFGENGSAWVGFDIDTIIGHAAGVGLSDEVLEKIEDALERVDYVELRRSTRGLGRHLYVHLEGFSTTNHTEHAALGRAVLSKLSHDVGLDLSKSVDACGANLWFWSLRATEENRGFELIQLALRKLNPEDVPNWRDHVDVVTRKRSKIRVEHLDEEFASSQLPYSRDSEHDKIFAEYQRLGFSFIYHADHGCYHLHTRGLALTHRNLRLKGAFETLSDGKDPGKPNCFAFLRRDGGLFIVRFDTAQESSLWDKTKTGSPCCTYNTPLDPQNVSRIAGGVWTGKGFTCHTFDQAKRAADLFGIALPEISDRPINFKIEGGGLLVSCDRAGKEIVNEWGAEGRKLKRHFAINLPTACDEHENVVRHLVSPTNEDAGWAVQRADGSWGIEKKDTLHCVLQFYGYRDRAGEIIGACALRPWTLVNEPFKPEFLSGRRWNRHGWKLIVPARAGNHPHFDRIFAHCGAGLDDAVAENPWCRKHGILNGKQYLLLWAAGLVQRPKVPLPYLFFWSKENNTGKSSVHRSLGMVFDKSPVNVYAALTEKYNQQMAGAVLCFVEESTLPPGVYSKLKSWIEAPTIVIREMNTNAYTLPNYAHFIQSANNRDACPIEPGDERIVVIHVNPLDCDIPWFEKLEPVLRQEAPSFLGTLLEMELPPAAGRLFLPVLTTSDKEEMMQTATTSDVRGIVVRAVADAVKKLIDREKFWQGTAGDLLGKIGKGPWTASPATLSSYLGDAVEPLKRMDISVCISETLNEGQRKITIGPAQHDFERPTPIVASH